MKCEDPCGIFTAWRIIVTAIKAKTTQRKRTSVDGVIIEEQEFDVHKASHKWPGKRLSGNASALRRGTAATVSELEGLRRPSQIPGEIMFDAEDPAELDRGGVISKPKPAMLKTDFERHKDANDANELDAAEIESLVSTPRDAPDEEEGP